MVGRGQAAAVCDAVEESGPLSVLVDETSQGGMLTAGAQSRFAKALGAVSLDAIPKRLLVIGGGGREHALAWKLAQSQRVQKVYVAPGNGGTAADARLRNVPITELAALVEFALHEKITLTVVGPRGRWRPAWTCASAARARSSRPRWIR